MADRQEENIGNLKSLRAMIRKDMNTVAQVNKVQDKIEGMTTAGKKALSSEIADFKKLRKNVLARKEKDLDPRPANRAMAPKEGGPKIPTQLPKSKPKRPKKVAAKKESSGVIFDTSGTLPGQTIKRMNSGGAAFPDLTGDGKVTKKDILKGRGVTGFEKGGKAIKESKFGKMGEALMGGLAKSLRKKTGNSISNADKAAVRKLVQETGNKTDRQIMQFEHGGEVRGMGKAYMGPPKKVKIR